MSDHFSLYALMSFISRFGSILLLGLLSAAIALWLTLRGQRRGAWAWCLSLTAVGGLTAALKIYFEACSLRPYDVHSPSGHAAFSAIAYGGLAVVALRARRHWLASAATALLALWVLLIGVSRVVIRAHTSAEVVAGLLIGGAGLVFFGLCYRGARPPSPALLALGAVALAAAALALPLDRFALEPYLIRLGARLAAHRPLLCVADQI